MNNLDKYNLDNLNNYKNKIKLNFIGSTIIFLIILLIIYTNSLVNYKPTFYIINYKICIIISLFAYLVTFSSMIYNLNQYFKYKQNMKDIQKLSKPKNKNNKFLHKNRMTCLKTNENCIYRLKGEYPNCDNCDKFK